MSLFDFNPFRASEELTPAQLRGVKMMAWLRTLLRPLKYISDLFTDDYCLGSNAPAYNSATTYVKYDRVYWTDYGVYELQVNTSVGVDPTGEATSVTNWRKILDDFIGADERIRYTAQHITFEYALNRRFGVTSAPYIYIESTALGVSSNAINFYFPIAVWNTMGTTTAERYGKAYEFIYKYSLSGYQIFIFTF